jgi:mRNA-degrading endonuclease toxin of MazEF toxin-antitoxin module
MDGSTPGEMLPWSITWTPGSVASPDKKRPVLILTRSSAIPYLSRVSVAPITPTIRGVRSEVTLRSRTGCDSHVLPTFTTW